MDDGELSKSTTGKLRFKSRKEPRERNNEEISKDKEARHSGRRHKRSRKDDIETFAAGPSCHPSAIFGDDLLRAERYEAQQNEEKKWSAKLDELLQDDLRGGFTESSSVYTGNADDAAWEEEIMRMRGVQFSGEAHQEIPKRWQDAAKGFESRMGRGAGGITDLDEEEYAEYIREGMYRRKHASDIAFEEDRQRRWNEAQAKKKSAKEEKRQLKKKRQEEKEKESARRALDRARDAWEADWLQMTSTSQFIDPSKKIPWPVYPGPELTKDSIVYFLFYDSDKEESSKRLRKALLRYHPDRFLSSRYFVDIHVEKEKAAVREAVEKVAKILSEVIDDRRG